MTEQSKASANYSGNAGSSSSKLPNQPLLIKRRQLWIGPDFRGTYVAPGYFEKLRPDSVKTPLID